ncbi:MAG: nicotinate-nucleotide adenylyltransferase [Gammaproteobacteria bacterium]
MKNMPELPIGLFGGTFDPIHSGHLRAAVEIYQNIPLQTIRFIPCKQPVHKAAPYASPEQRLAMLRLALAVHPSFSIDERELNRHTPSYMVETLESMRAEIPATPLCLILGTDALLNFCTWHRWEDILKLAHLIVVRRLGYPAIPPASKIADVIQQRQCLYPDHLHYAPAGHIFFQAITTLDITSTQIRNDVMINRSPRYLIPDTVAAYIDNERVYI